MPKASIEYWASCPECGGSLEFDGYRENPLVCKGTQWSSDDECEWTESDGSKSFTDFMTCPNCGSWRVDAKGGGYRENSVYCEDCGFEEGEFYDRYE